MRVLAAPFLSICPPWNASHKNNFQTQWLAACVTFKKGWPQDHRALIGLPLRSQTISIFYRVAGNLLLGCLETPFYGMLLLRTGNENYFIWCFHWGLDQVFKVEDNPVGFEVLTVVNTKMAVFWVVAPCSLVGVYQRFRGPCCLHHQGDDSSSRTTQFPNHCGLYPRDREIPERNGRSPEVHQ
jgi:hypothetical protein